MPIQIIATEGVLPVAKEQEVFAALSDCFLRSHGLIGNAFMTPNVIGEITIVAKGRTFSGGKPSEIVIVELKAPSFAFATSEQKQGFITEATDIVVKATGGKHPKDRIYINMVYAVDGMWGIAGKAYSNAQLGDAISGKTCCAEKNAACCG